MKFKEYLFSYRFGGKNWIVSVFATSPDEAKEKIKAVAHAEYDGEIMANIYIPVKAAWFQRFIAWIKR
nr:hypothetical protein [uncultured Kingella sp.]